MPGSLENVPAGFKESLTERVVLSERAGTSLKLAMSDFAGSQASCYTHFLSVLYHNVKWQGSMLDSVTVGTDGAWRLGNGTSSSIGKS
jgi:hypothetical protein